MLTNIKKLLLIARPISWPNTAYPFAAAYLVTGGSFDMFFWIATLYFLIPYNLLMYGINDVFDYESDSKNPRKGGLEGAREQKAFHPIIIWSAVALNVPFIAYLFITGTPLANCALALILFFVVAYSIAGLRFKEKPFLDSITSSLHFVGPMLYALVITGFEPSYMPFIIAFFVWGMASHAFGAVQDIIPDRQGHLSSIATVLGARHTTRLSLWLYLAASVLLMFQAWPTPIAGTTLLLYVGNVAPFYFTTDKDSARTNTGWRRFIWLNLLSGFVITMLLLLNAGLF